MLEFISTYGIYIIGSLLFIILLSLIKLISLQSKYNNYMMKSSAKNVEGLINEYLEKVELSLSKEDNLTTRIENLEAEMLSCIKKVGVIRYNPYEDMGANLCFAVALLNDHNDGVVFNGIFDRSGSRTYAKPITDGKSEYVLSEEELTAIDNAKKS